jgi:hypothetical protein
MGPKKRKPNLGGAVKKIGGPLGDWKEGPLGKNPVMLTHFSGELFPYKEEEEGKS